MRRDTADLPRRSSLQLAVKQGGGSRRETRPGPATAGQATVESESLQKDCFPARTGRRIGGSAGKNPFPTGHLRPE
jgi:hypothetical protein